MKEAMAAIHACGVVHRDLKPANVLLATDGPRVIDFGISRATDGTMLTAAGVVFGTPGYMSPEQAEGRPAGPPSDMFALGCVLAYAACGAGPFGTGTAAAVLYRDTGPSAVSFWPRPVANVIGAHQARLEQDTKGLGLPKVLTTLSWLIACGAVVFLWQRPSSAFFQRATAPGRRSEVGFHNGYERSRATRAHTEADRKWLMTTAG